MNIESTTTMHPLKTMFRYLILLLPVLLGCSHVTVMRQIPGTHIKPVKISAISLLGPTINQLTYIDSLTGEFVPPPPGPSASGNGIAGSILEASGQVAGSAVWGLSRRPDKTVVNQSGGGGGGGASTGPIDVSSDSTSQSKSDAKADAKSDSRSNAQSKGGKIDVDVNTKIENKPKKDEHSKQDRRKW